MAEGEGASACLELENLPLMLIALDDPSTWPAELVAILRDSLPVLRGYQDNRVSNDRLRDENPNDIMLRIHPPTNPFRAARDGLVAEIEAQLVGKSVLAWHCTRLCQDEIEAAKEAGLFLLSPETFGARVQQRRKVGDITSAVAERLQGKNQAHEEHRRGQLWFVLTRNLLATSGVADLFGFWGGEALYNSHDRDTVVGPILSSLGKPCILELAIPSSRVATFDRLGITIVRVFELADGLQDDNRADCQGFTREPIAASEVLRVITAGDPAFDDLTFSDPA